MKTSPDGEGLHRERQNIAREDENVVDIAQKNERHSVGYNGETLK